MTAFTGAPAQQRSPARPAEAAARARVAAEADRKATQRAAAGADCRLADGTRIEIFANLGRVGEGARAVADGAEGCGLL
ncbi:hypothetical protein J8J27_25675, partial [Mycobacterium tuberculosis]|nr:hypothetical protein [Mycobacterium tuberculosis]